MEWLLRNSILKKMRLWKCLHLSQTEQSACLLHAFHWNLQREDHIIQEGKLAGDHSAWPGYGHFSCLVLSFATNHPARTRQQQLQFTHLWRMVTSALSMVKFTANNQYVFSGEELSFTSVIGESQAEIISLVTWRQSVSTALLPGLSTGVQLLKFWGIEHVCEFSSCGQKRGHILNLTSSGEVCMTGLTNSETESNHIRFSELKNS